MTKYGAKKVTFKGITFDSSMEMEYYQYLLIQKAKGLVNEIRLQPKYRLLEPFEKLNVKYRAIDYVADFEVDYSDGRTVTIDVKGMETTDFKIKAKLFNDKYRELPLVLISKSNIDGGWIELKDLKKVRAKRRKEKKLNQGK